MYALWGSKTQHSPEARATELRCLCVCLLGPRPYGKMIAASGIWPRYRFPILDASGSLRGIELNAIP